jgi:putative ABC transport system ATP-binding protein
VSVPLPTDMSESQPLPDSRGSAIVARSLHRFYRIGDQETLALQGVTLQVELGEFVAVVGPSGSGKSTLLACLAGLDEPDGGSVEIAGRPMTRRSEQERARIRARHVGMVFQSANLLEHLTLDQNVALVQHLGGATGRSDRAALFESLGLSHRARIYPSRLSGGESSRAALAVALANEPAVLLADEPTGELDTATEAEVLELLRRTVERGAAVLVASHSQAVAAAADRRIMLIDGRVVSS